MAYHVNTFDPGHTLIDQQIKNTQATFASPSNNAVEKQKEKKRKRKAIANPFALQANTRERFKSIAIYEISKLYTKIP